MRILLTSFGVSERMIESVDRVANPFIEDLRIQRVVHGELDYSNAGAFSYAQMPPVDMRSFSNHFMPDYATILLADKIIMDEESFDRLVSRPHTLYSHVAKAVKELHRSGFVQLENYRAILLRREPLLAKMLELDLEALDPWIAPLKESLETWRKFSELASSAMLHEPDPTRGHFLHHYARSLRNAVAHTTFPHPQDGSHGFRRGNVPADAFLVKLLSSAKARRLAENRDILKSVLEYYLKYVNANLVLAQELDAGFHDWADFLPFYRRKFIPIGRDEVEIEEHAKQLQQLFSIPFPELAIKDTTHLMKVLEDPRVESLRRLISSAVEGDVAFDEQFAKNTLKDILGAQSSSTRWSFITSFITKPLGKIPWVGAMLQPSLEWLVHSRLEAQAKKDFQWYYLLSSATTDSRGGV